MADAEGDKQRFLSHQARKGGRAKKSDALQQEILGLVRRDPHITESRLKDMLTKERCPGLIEDVNDEEIYFVQRDGSEEGRSKRVVISGLKHRLWRAKKALKSR